MKCQSLFFFFFLKNYFKLLSAENFTQHASIKAPKSDLGLHCLLRPVCLNISDIIFYDPTSDDAGGI